MEKYLNRAFLWDVTIAVIVGNILYFAKPYLTFCLDVPSPSNVDKIGASLISIGATLVGFLLTIITVIITFKKGFDSETKEGEQVKEIDLSQVPSTTVFDKTISKENQFYGTTLHKQVLHVFIGATYEIGLVILILLLIQFNLVRLSELIIALITLGCLIMTFLTTLRSINVFKSYLNVHTGHKNKSTRSNR